MPPPSRKNPRLTSQEKESGFQNMKRISSSDTESNSFTCECGFVIIWKENTKIIFEFERTYF